MSNEECRRYRQQTAEVGVTVHQKSETIPATLIDMNPDGIVLISEKRIMPGTEVDITTNYIDDLAIHGTIKMVLLINRGGKFQYRLGIEADQILGPEDILENLSAETTRQDSIIPFCQERPKAKYFI